MKIRESRESLFAGKNEGGGGVKQERTCSNGTTFSSITLKKFFLYIFYVFNVHYLSLKYERKCIYCK